MAGKSLLHSILGSRCPSCREGKLYCDANPYRKPTDTLKMHPQCPNCGQDFQIEPGFYFGATYVSYGLNIALVVAVIVAINVLWEPTLWRIAGIWVPLTIVLFPVIARWSRSIWIHAFVKYKSEEERLANPQLLKGK